MSIIKIPTFHSEMGEIFFIQTSGAFRVAFRDPSGKARAIGWTEEKPSAKIARFFFRVAAAENEGKDRYFYADKNIDPST